MNCLNTYRGKLAPVQASEAETLIPGYRQKVELSCIETDEKTFITCNTNLYFCPSSPGFAHGPVIMRYVSTAAEKILEKEEKIRVISKVLFRKIIRKNMRIIIYDDECKNDRSTSDSSVTGAFITSKGRRLIFCCIPLKSKGITRQAGLNTFAIDLVIPIRFRTNGEIYKFKLNSALCKKKHDYDVHDVSMIIYILMEIEIILIINFQNDFSLQKQWYLLLGKLENLEIPASMDDVLNNETELELQFLRKRILSGTNGLSCLQYSLSLPFFAATPFFAAMSKPLIITMFGTESLSLIKKTLGIYN